MLGTASVCVVVINVFPREDYGPKSTDVFRTGLAAAAHDDGIPSATSLGCFDHFGDLTFPGLLYTCQPSLMHTDKIVEIYRIRVLLTFGGTLPSGTSHFCVVVL